MLEREVADPRIGFVTVTSVETDPDLRHARVWVSIIGGTAERSQALEALDHTMGFIRRELGTRLRLKRIPDLHVRLDDSIERGTRVLQLIDSIETGREPGGRTAGESLPTPTRGAAPAGPASVDAPSGEATGGAPADRDDGDGFGAAAAEYAASLAASLEERRARRPRPSGSGGGRAAPGARPDRRPGGRPRGGGGGAR